MKIAYRVQGGVEIDAGFEQAVIDAIALNASRHFSEVVAPHAVQAAKGNCPVSSENRYNFNPRKSSFSSVQLIKKLPPLPKAAGPRQVRAHQAARLRLSKLQKNEAEVDPKTDAQFFRGSGGRTPDALGFRRGGVVGAFRRPRGTLKKSIKFDGVRRSGNRVVAVVRAHAPYAIYIHQGFTHEGGRHHDGHATKIAGRPFLKQVVPYIRDELLDAKAYG